LGSKDIKAAQWYTRSIFSKVILEEEISVISASTRISSNNSAFILGCKRALFYLWIGNYDTLPELVLGLFCNCNAK
jgi:hypothetical protein